MMRLANKEAALRNMDPAYLATGCADCRESNAAWPYPGHVAFWAVCHFGCAAYFCLDCSRKAVPVLSYRHHRPLAGYGQWR